MAACWPHGKLSLNVMFPTRTFHFASPEIARTLFINLLSADAIRVDQPNLTSRDASMLSNGASISRLPSTLPRCPPHITENWPPVLPTKVFFDANMPRLQKLLGEYPSLRHKYISTQPPRHRCQNLYRRLIDRRLDQLLAESAGLLLSHTITVLSFCFLQTLLTGPLRNDMKGPPFYPTSMPKQHRSLPFHLFSRSCDQLLLNMCSSPDIAGTAMMSRQDA